MKRLLILMVITAFVLAGCSGNTTDGSDYDGEKVKLDFYVMSQCPYGTQVVDAIDPVLDKFGDAIDFNLEYIANVENGELTSLHGTSEVKGNIAQLCAQKYNPDKYMDMIVCQNKNSDNIPGNWKECAESNDLDVEKIESCYDGEEGKELLKESLQKAKNVGATGSPTIFLNNESYSGGRSTSAFTQSICEEIPEHPECGDVSEPPQVEMFIVNPENCTNCDTSNMVKATEQLFQNLEIKEYKLSSEKGQELVDKYDLEKAPSYVFSQTVENTSKWGNKQIRAAFSEAGSKYKIKPQASGATYIIDDEKRKQQQQMMEQYPQENLEVLNHTSGKPRLDYFVMAFCPYGNPADKAVSKVHEKLGDDVKIVPHYILNMRNGKVSSMHGSQEANQGVRELCAHDKLGKEKFFDFVIEVNDQCSSKNADNCWKGAAKDAGLTESDISKIESCEESNKKSIGKSQADTISNLKSERRGQLVAPRSSPTFLIDGKTFNQRSADALKNELCSKFDEKPAACSESIETTSTNTGGGGGSC